MADKNPAAAEVAAEAAKFEKENLRRTSTKEPSLPTKEDIAQEVTVMNKDKVQDELESFKSDKLRHAETTVHNTLPKPEEIQHEKTTMQKDQVVRNVGSFNSSELKNVTTVVKNELPSPAQIEEERKGQ